MILHILKPFIKIKKILGIIVLGLILININFINYSFAGDKFWKSDSWKNIQRMNRENSKQRALGR